MSFLLNICIAISLCSCVNIKKDDSIENKNSEWSDLLVEAYRALNENPSVEAADQLYQATERMPTKNWENYLVAATIYAPNGEKDKAFNAIEKAIEGGLKDSKLLNTIPELSSLHNDPKWNILIDEAINKREKYLTAIQNPALLEELENMWKLDQQALSEYEQNSKFLDITATSETYAKLFEPVEERWEINKQKLDSIITLYGWPGYKLVGEDGAKISWAIPQHYPGVFFKEKCLSLLKKAVEKGDANPNHYAELLDRIARETWQKQIFGASMGEERPYPIKDPANVDDRRLKLGLTEPIEVYAYYHGITYQRPTLEEAQLQLKTALEAAQKNYQKFEQSITNNKIDSANIYIRKAIKSYGDITNEQLYQAALKLAQTTNKQSINNSIKIVKVLIWRKWDGRYDILKNDKFTPLYTSEEWKNIGQLLQKSKL